jgi:uncharacterized membrane protein
MDLKTLLAATKQLGEMGLLSQEDISSTQIKILEKELSKLHQSLEEVIEELTEPVKSRFSLQIRLLQIITKTQYA